MSWVAVAVGGGALISGGVSALSAKRASDAQGKQNDIAQQQADLAKKMYNETAGVRGAGNADLENYLKTGALPYALNYPYPPEDFGLMEFMQGGALPAALQPAARPSVPNMDLTAPNRDVLEAQFNRAREATINQAGSQGGALAGDLASLEGQRAFGVTQIYNDQRGKQAERQYAADTAAAAAEDALRQKLYGAGTDLAQQQAQKEQDLRKALFSSALGIGSGSANSALGGLAGASGSYGNVAAANLQATNMGLEGLGATLPYGLAALQKQGQQPAATPATPFYRPSDWMVD